jgi:hypothetical protein
MDTPVKQNKVFRFNLDENIMTLITQFAKIHRYDDRHTYKEHWTEWVKDNIESIEREMNRLTQLGYTGDVLDKMFKAGRYYFREKAAAATTAAATTAAATTAAATTAAATTAAAATEVVRRHYIVMQQEIIQLMDNHLKTIIKLQDFKPATAYVHFCENNLDSLRTEVIRLKQQNVNFTAETLSTKIKKTYKNRYFILNKA